MERQKPHGVQVHDGEHLLSLLISRDHSDTLPTQPHACLSGSHLVSYVYLLSGIRGGYKIVTTFTFQFP